MSNLDIEKLTTEPNNTPVGQIVAKVIMGFIIGLIIAFLVFVVTILFNTVIQQGVRAISTDSQV